MKKKNLSIIIILILIITALIGYIYYDKFLNNNVKNPANEKQEENINNNNKEDNDLIKTLKPVFDFAYEYFDTSNTYCGEHSSYADYISMRENPTTKNPTNGFFGSKQFKNYQEMMDYLKQYMSEEVINQKHTIKKEFYIEQDNKLYCEDLGKGSNIYQRENTIIEINTSDDNNVTATITVELLAEEEAKNSIIYDISFVKTNNNWIINSYKIKTV